MQIEKSNKALDILRWIGFLPGAVLTAWLAWIAVNILGRFSLSWAGITPDDFLGKVYFITAGHGALGAVFVYAGAKIAPANRVIIAFILGGIGIIAAGFLLFPAVIHKDWWSVFGSIFVGIGAGAVVWSVHIGETDL